MKTEFPSLPAKCIVRHIPRQAVMAAVTDMERLHLVELYTTRVQHSEE